MKQGTPINSITISTNGHGMQTRDNLNLSMFVFAISKRETVCNFFQWHSICLQKSVFCVDWLSTHRNVLVNLLTIVESQLLSSFSHSIQCNLRGIQLAQVPSVGRIIEQLVLLGCKSHNDSFMLVLCWTVP